VILAGPKEDRRRFMIHAYDAGMTTATVAGMTTGDYVFFTVDMLPDEKLLDAEYVWKGNDGRDAEARKAFEAVFHVSNGAGFTVITRQRLSK